MSIIGTRRWAVVRAYVLGRDGHRCRMLIDGHICGAYADTVQHLIRREHGGTDELANLVAACGGCNYGERTSEPPAPPVRLSYRAILIIDVLDAAGAACAMGRRRAAALLVAARPGERFRPADIDAACRWRRRRGPLVRL